MSPRSLGATGLQVSEIGFGGAALGALPAGPAADEAIAALRAALKAGVDLVETASGQAALRSDRRIAEVLASQATAAPPRLAVPVPPAEGPWPPAPYCRWQDRYGAAYLREHVEHRLQSLQVDRLDVLLLDTWTRAWNDDPQPLLVLRRLKEEGKLGCIGVRTPPHDPACVIQLMRDGLVDVVQVVFHLFDQEAAAQLLPVATETATGVLVGTPLDHGALSGTWGPATSFGEADVRRGIFAGERLPETLGHVEAVRNDVRRFGLETRYALSDVALKFVLAQPAVSSVVVGMRNIAQVQKNTSTVALPDLPAALLQTLQRHNWRRGFWTASRTAPRPIA